jgi:NADP-dependent 3-hydroxy acid dehydrogenase YdfG
MSKPYELNGKVVWITGAAGGIGAASAHALYKQGACLVLTDVTQASVDALAATFDAQRVLALSLDVTDAVATMAVVSATVARFGRLDNQGQVVPRPSTRS